MTQELMLALLAQIEAVMAAQKWPVPSAVKRGRNPKWPYVPVLVYPHGATANPVKGLAYATREEAVARAAAHLTALQNSLRDQMATPRCRALRKSYGLPEEI